MRMMNTQVATVCALLALGGLSGLGGCARTSIAVKEYFGYAKRSQLVDKVESARDAQSAAKKQFTSALDQFMAVTGAKGGELEARYRALQKEYERSEARAKGVRDRIGEVETVGEALFSEWRSELGQYSNADMRRAAEAQLQDTRTQYDRLVGVMKQAASKMDPVLAAFKDQTLFLKHNLNARAVASLQGNAAQIQGDIATLVREMEAAIAESNAFIAQMKSD